MEPLELRDSDGDAQGSPTDSPSAVVADSKPSQATRLVELVKGSGALLFHDDQGEGWAQFSLNEHREHWPCRSKPFKRWLARLFWNFEGKAPNSDAINAAVNVLEAQARFDGPQHTLHNRVALINEEIWYDLTDSTWRAVRIHVRGWEIVTDPPIIFRRHAHQRPQVVPQHGGDLHQLLDFINIRDPKHRLLLLVYLVSCFVPEIPHPVPILHGPQGAAKTTLLRILRRLADPSLTETLAAPGNITALVQQLSHHWLAYYDNLGNVPEWFSDALCRAVTGEGFSKRELYTDDDDVIYHFRRCCGLNGINVAAAKPDLLDRALLFGLEPIPKDRRKSEKEMWRAFDRALPALLGAAFEALSKALRIYPSVELGELDRMADFTLWGCAIAEALAHARQEFLDALDQNFHHRNDEVIASDPVATATAAFARKHGEWRGNASDLLGELEQVATALKLDRRSKRWPKGPNILTRRLNEVASNLAASGTLITHERTGKERVIFLRHAPDRDDDAERVPSQVPSPEKSDNSARNDDGDGCDGTSPTSAGAGLRSEIQRVAPKSTESIVTTVITVTEDEFPRLFSDGSGDGTTFEPSHPSSPAASLRSTGACGCGSSESWVSAHGDRLCQRCGAILARRAEHD